MRLAESIEKCGGYNTTVIVLSNRRPHLVFNNSSEWLMAGGICSDTDPPAQLRLVDWQLFIVGRSHKEGGKGPLSSSSFCAGPISARWCRGRSMLENELLCAPTWWERLASAGAEYDKHDASRPDPQPW
jgi:hypothetical protein